VFIGAGVKLTRIHRALKFNQRCYLKDWVDKCTEGRQKATACGDGNLKNFFKLMVNSVFGKSIQRQAAQVFILL